MSYVPRPLRRRSSRRQPPRFRTLALADRGFALVIDRLGYVERFDESLVQALRVETGARTVLLFEYEVDLGGQQVRGALSAACDRVVTSAARRRFRTPSG